MSCLLFSQRSPHPMPATAAAAAAVAARALLYHHHSPITENNNNKDNNNDHNNKIGNNNKNNNNNINNNNENENENETSPSSSELMPVEYDHSIVNPWNSDHQFSQQHQRASSDSSVGSVGPSTPSYPSQTSPLVSAASDYYDAVPTSDSTTQYHIHSHETPLRDVFPLAAPAKPDMGPPYPSEADPDLAAIIALQQKNYQHERPEGEAEEEARPEDEDGRRKLHMLSRHESSDDCEGRRKMDYQQQVPKLDRTISDVFADELYSPNFLMTSAQPPRSAESVAPSSTSNAQSLIAQRLRAANSQHLSAPSQFPLANAPRGDRSPFRQGSPLDPSPIVAFPMSPLAAASERDKAEHDARVLEQHMRKHSPGRHDTQQTISPKDALLEYHEAEEDVSMGPLIDAHDASPYRHSKADAEAADETESLQGFDSMATSRRESSSVYSPSSQTTTQPSAHAFGFAPPSIAGRPPMPAVPPPYAFLGNQGLRAAKADHGNPDTGSPEFHSALVSMESSSSDYVPDAERLKPAHVAADAGTYTCTYQGCPLRFDTPAKLQKHKKDGHRQIGATASPPTTGPGSTDGGAAPSSSRNTQAGPHRCDRVNPSTGKPCHTVFSRPYDLTRHEDTIHNARHQKIRCELCTEVKTFSRNDALTRHFRVVHPDAEPPGKTRRRHVDH